MATCSSILVYKSPWTEEPGRLQFMELQSDTAEHMNTDTQDITVKVPVKLLPLCNFHCSEKTAGGAQIKIKQSDPCKTDGLGSHSVVREDLTEEVVSEVIHPP